MSRANVDYLLRHNPEIDAARVEICPNSIEIHNETIDPVQRAAIRAKYGVPADRKVFVYGGNLGRPQGIPQLIECLKQVENRAGAHFLIVGSGTEAHRLEAYLAERRPGNVQYLSMLPKADYEQLTAACDVGLIFLDHKFTIPNFPSRLLSYMQARLPVLAATDPNTDVGLVAEENGFGWRCGSDDPTAFARMVDLALAADLNAMGDRGFDCLKRLYDVEQSYQIIIQSLQR